MMDARKQVWFWIAPLFVWLSAIFAATLVIHLSCVLTSPSSLRDGQYVMVFPFGIAVGMIAGLLPAGTVACLVRQKPQFHLVASWVALGHAICWALVAILCEAIFVEGWTGGGALLTLVFLTLMLPASLFFLVFALTQPSDLLLSCLWLLPFVVALLIAFYLTPPRGWQGEPTDSEEQR